MSNELTVVNAQNAVQIFTGGGMKALLDEIEAKVRAIPLDASTALGREEIRSTAYRVARTKTALDAEGKRLTEGWREATKKVNEERKAATDRLDALAAEVRKPLTEFENKERLRVQSHEEALKDITGLHAMIAAYPEMTAQLLEDHLRDLRAAQLGRDWEEFASRAKTARDDAEKYVSKRIEDRKRYEAEQAELARLRKEETERQIREREEKLKSEAAEHARLQAERKAKDEADREARRVIEAAETERRRVDAERKEAERKAQAEKAALQAQVRAEEQKRQAEERERIASEKRAKEAAERAAADLRAAKEKAKRDAEAAVARERERAAREKEAAERVKAQREADEANRARIHADITADVAKTIEGVECTAIVGAIINGLIRHVKVVY